MDSTQDTPEVAQSRARSWLVLDLVLCALALLVIAEHLRARSVYAIYPFFVPILSAILIAASPGYRLRARRILRDLWSDSEAFAAGSGRIPWMAAVALVVLPTWLIYLSNQRTIGASDTKPVIPTAVSLLTEGDSELGEYFVEDARISLWDKNGKMKLCFRRTNGGIYSSYPAGMVPFALATTALADSLGANLLDEQVQRRLEKMTAAAISALAVGLFFLVALCLAPARAAWITSAILAVGSGMFSTVGMALWQHGGIILWASVALLIEFTSAGRPTRWGTACQGLCCALMVACRLTSASFLVPFGAWVLFRDPKRALAIVGVAAAAFAPWSWFYASTYGNPLGPSLSFLTSDNWTPELFVPLLGVLASPARGLFIYQPWILLAPLAFFIGRCPESWPRPAPVGWMWFLSAAIAMHVGLIAVWGCWWGGWCWGSRLLVEVVPLCGLLCVRPIALLLDARWGRILVLSLALLGVAAQLPGVYSNPSRWNATAHVPEDLWSWTKAPFLYDLSN